MDVGLSAEHEQLRNVNTPEEYADLLRDGE